MPKRGPEMAGKDVLRGDRGEAMAMSKRCVVQGRSKRKIRRGDAAVTAIKATMG